MNPDPADGSYNKNIGDPDISSQDNTLGVQNVSTEHVLLKCWTGNESAPDTFSFYTFPLSGGNVYINNLKVCESVAPSCVFSVPFEVVHGDNITINSFASADSTFLWDSKTFYQTKTHFAHDIFSNVGITTYENDLSQGDGFVLGSVSSIGVISSVGTHTIYHRATNSYGLSSTCQREINIVNYVFPFFVLSPTSPFINEAMAITPDITGDTNTITNVYYRIYNVDDMQEYVEITTLDDGITDIDGSNYNTPLTHVFTDAQKLNWIMFQYVTYDTLDNGNIVTTSYNRSISLQTLAPTLDLTALEIDAETRTWSFFDGALAVDAPLSTIRWELFNAIDDTDGVDVMDVLIFDSGAIPYSENLENLSIPNSGDILIRVTVEDTAGASVIDTITISMYCGTTIQVCDAVGIDWSYTVEDLLFAVSTQRLEIDITSEDLIFDISDSIINFDISIEELRFDLEIVELKFTID